MSDDTRREIERRGKGVKGGKKMLSKRGWSCGSRASDLFHGWLHRGGSCHGGTLSSGQTWPFSLRGVRAIKREPSLMPVVARKRANICRGLVRAITFSTGLDKRFRQSWKVRNVLARWANRWKFRSPNKWLNIHSSRRLCVWQSCNVLIQEYGGR